jgi:hypothetical protein
MAIVFRLNTVAIIDTTQNGMNNIMILLPSLDFRFTAKKTETVDFLALVAFGN